MTASERYCLQLCLPITGREALCAQNIILCDRAGNRSPEPALRNELAPTCFPPTEAVRHTHLLTHTYRNSHPATSYHKPYANCVLTLISGSMLATVVGCVSRRLPSILPSIKRH